MRCSVHSSSLDGPAPVTGVELPRKTTPSLRCDRSSHPTRTPDIGSTPTVTSAFHSLHFYFVCFLPAPQSVPKGPSYHPASMVRWSHGTCMSLFMLQQVGPVVNKKQSGEQEQRHWISHPTCSSACSCPESTHDCWTGCSICPHLQQTAPTMPTASVHPTPHGLSRSRTDGWTTNFATVPTQ